MENYHLTIFGRVQGVGFRWRVYQLAQQLEVSGFVRNQIDGSVYCELQGETDAVKKLISKIKAGPTPYAEVVDVLIEHGKATNYNNSFSIRR